MAKLYPQESRCRAPVHAFPPDNFIGDSFRRARYKVTSYRDRGPGVERERRSKQPRAEHLDDAV